MKRTGLLSIPLLWLFLGPPVFRYPEARAATASLEGHYDAWNYVRLAWWAAAGLAAALALYRADRSRRALLDRAGSIPLWVVLWLGALFASAAFSPAPLFTAANAAMLAILVIAGLDVGVRVHGGQLSARRVLLGLLVVATGLLVLVGTLYFVDPLLIDVDRDEGLRIRGGDIAYSPLISLVAFFTGLYFWLTSRGAARWACVPVMALGLIFLALGQTRSAYGGLVGGLAVFVWRWNRLGRDAARLLAVAAACLAVVGLGGVLYGLPTTYEELKGVESFVVRNRQSVSTLSGRTEVAALLLERVRTRPMGLGFSAGPRLVLQTSPEITARYGDGFGNAHNAYLEVFAGAGWAALAAWLAVVGLVLWRARRVRSRAMVPAAALLAVVLLEGLTESELVLPFSQTGVVFWASAAIVVALSRRAGAAPAPSALRPVPRRPS